MTDFVLSAKLTADASGLTSGARDGARAVDELGKAGESAGRGLSRVGSASRNFGAAMAPVRTSLDEQGRAAGNLERILQRLENEYDKSGAPMRRYQADLSDINTLLKAHAIDAEHAAMLQGRATAAFNTSSAAIRSGAVSAGAAAQGYRQLSFQTGDVVQGLAMGVNPAIVFGQQIGQIGQAAEMTGGKLGAFGKFMMGPWGLALQFGVILLGTLASKFFESGKAAEDSAGKVDVHRMSVEELTKAIRDQEQALKDLLRTEQQTDEQREQKAKDELDAARKKAVEKREELQRAQADEREAAAAALRVQGAGASLAAAQAREQRIRSELDKLEKDITVAEANVRSARTPILNRNVEASLDPAKAATDRYTQSLGVLQDMLRAGLISESQYTAGLREATVERNRAIEAARKAEQAERNLSSTRGRNMQMEADVDARLRAIGARITSGYRTPEENRRVDGALNSYHLKGQARDIAKTAGMTKQAIRDALQGLDIKELIDEGDHFHVAWGGALRGVSQEAREAAKAAKQLDSDLASLIKQFDPATAAANEYADTLAKIKGLRDAGRITDDQANEFDRQARLKRFDDVAAAERQSRQKLLKELPADFSKPLEIIGDKTSAVMTRAGRAGGAAFRTAGIDAAQAIAQIFGGKIGRVVGPILGALSGTRTGNFNSVGGPLGGVLTLLGGGLKRGSLSVPGDVMAPGGGIGGGRMKLPLGGTIAAPPDLIGRDGFIGGLEDVFDPIRKGLDGLVGKLGGIFGEQGNFTRLLGKAAGFGAIGGGLGGLTGSKTGGAIGGALGGFAGEAIAKGMGTALGSLGQFAGPIGAIAGGLLGGVIGGALKKVKKGMASISSVDGEATLSGNSTSMRNAAGGLAGNVQDALSQIAEALGGEVGAFNVAIGYRDGKVRVDPTGRGVTKKKNGAIDFGKNGEEAAVSFAIADAIADGGVKGLSEAVQKAIRSNKDVDKALKEALKVDEVETLLKGVGGQIEKVFRDFERQAADRVRIARQYGFNVLKIEEINAQERAKLVEQTLSQRIGSLKDLLADMDFGDLFEGSMADQRTKLLAELAKARADAEAGVDGAAGRQSDLSRRLLELSRDAYGTAGGEFAADRSTVASGAERVIQLENERIKAAQEATRQTNAHLDEANDLAAIGNAKLDQIIALLGGVRAANAVGSIRFDTLRRSNLL